MAVYRPLALEAAGGSGSQDRVEDGANSRVPLVGMRGLVSLYSCNRLTSSHNMVVSMANTTKRTRNLLWNTLETFRTPEQHRRKIQGLGNSAKPIVKRVKPPKSKKKRARLDKLENGTSSLQSRLHLLGYRVYVDYLASPHWLDVKARWKAGNLFKGWVCHSYGCDSREGLSLHHWTYERLGSEDLSDLILVCRDCHQHIHRLERRGMALDEATKKVAKHLPMGARLPQPNPTERE
jgi:hypothetical protein